ncbi:hypothetical protein SERLA73DRAFT_66595, partial [Serpula lacrymans var. lacrymans S7.3]
LLDSPRFTQQLFNVTLDKSHCISKWGNSLRPEYGEIGYTCWLLPLHISFHCALATIPPHILDDVKDKLHTCSNMVKVHCTNDRPNIYY